MASVTLNNISKDFGAVKVLSGINLEIADGEFVVLVGPSGCGKSTLLRSIAGLEEVTGGDIIIGDRRVNDVVPRDRDIAMVFQSYALYPHMNVESNMSFSLKLRKESEDKIGTRVQSASSTLGLGTLLRRLPKQLSGGQRQRVAMGRAIVRDPKVFLFDEPLSNLDAKLRAQMRTEIKALHQKLGTTSIYVTHDQIEAMTMANRIVVLNEGIIQQVGAPLELYDKPANTFVAGFIGSPTMNFLNGIAAVGGEVRLTDGGMIATGAKSMRAGQEVTLGVRPEHLQLSDEGVPGEVLVVEPLGMTTQVAITAMDQVLTLMVMERTNLKPGEKIHLSAEPTRVHVFDRQRGRRLN